LIIKSLSEEVLAMSNLLGIVAGIVAIIIGFILLIAWWSMFAAVLKGVIPVLLILTGVGALVYFISEMKSRVPVDKEKPPSPIPVPPEGQKAE
jgi:hypothetical protein